MQLWDNNNSVIPFGPKARSAFSFNKAVDNRYISYGDTQSHQSTTKSIIARFLFSQRGHLHCSKEIICNGIYGYTYAITYILGNGTLLLYMELLYSASNNWVQRTHLKYIGGLLSIYIVISTVLSFANKMTWLLVTGLFVNSRYYYLHIHIYICLRINATEIFRIFEMHGDVIK